MSVLVFFAMNATSSNCGNNYGQYMYLLDSCPAACIIGFIWPGEYFLRASFYVCVNEIQVDAKIRKIRVVGQFLYGVLCVLLPGQLWPVAPLIPYL